MLRTKLDMESVRADVAKELSAILEAGVPLVYRENGIIVEVKKLDTVKSDNLSQEIHFHTAAE